AKQFQSHFKKCGYFVSTQHVDVENTQEVDDVNSWLKKQFSSSMLKNVNDNDSLKYALHNFYCYVKKNQQSALDQFTALHFYQPDDFLILDSATQKNLELIKNNQDGSRKNSLFSILDRAATSMGSRMVKKWIARPLVKKTAIEQRFDAVEALVKSVSLNQQTQMLLARIGDFERIVGRIALGRGTLQDYLGLKRTLVIIPQLSLLLSSKSDVVLLHIIVQRLGSFDDLHQLLDISLNDDFSSDWIIKKGFDPRLDRLRDLVGNSNKQIVKLEQQERASTGITSLKIRYNRVHGYYIEVTKPNVHLVPERYKRQQTLVGRERYTTDELRVLQHEIFTANNDIIAVEKEIFERVKQSVLQQVNFLRKSAHALAHCDALHAFACIAYDSGYVRPTFHEKRDIIIKQGRHPIVEQTLESHFISNNTDLIDSQSLWIITGPNMGGKSTYLRQVALICIMAQCGSFIPAQSADLPLLDRIFTRIGSGDNLAEGKSTFLVEMEETALICKHATRRSLVILDEVGRGTSTFDGLAIAQAVVEYLFSVVQSRCLFATHYHELTSLKDRFDGIASYYAASNKTNQGILFLYTMVQGVADGSFGLEVAKLAQLPHELVARADAILHELIITQKSLKNGKKDITIEPAVIDFSKNREMQVEIDRLKKVVYTQDCVLKKIKNIDYDDLSPKKAFDLLWDLK
ncbi:DNA mismatch repair protein MutS, partial [bacterium]|nr:DNA mismatch repair protein MutS [bacterium]